MNRTNIYLSDEQKARLNKETDRTGLSAAEITRRALDYWLDMKENPLEQMAEQVREGERKAVGGVDVLGEMFEMIRMMDDRLSLMLIAQPPEVIERLRAIAEQRESNRLVNAIPARDED